MGQQAWWQAHGHQLAPGTPLRVELHRTRARLVATGHQALPEIASAVITLALAPMRTPQGAARPVSPPEDCMTPTTIYLGDLPAIGAAFEGGTFAGLVTLPGGTHNAVALLPAQGDDLTWTQAGEWAQQQGGVLPTRPVAALLYANVKAKLRLEWHWTSEEHSASSAWTCDFSNGTQTSNHKSFEGSAVAVRLIPLSA